MIIYFQLYICVLVTLKGKNERERIPYIGKPFAQLLLFSIGKERDWNLLLPVCSCCNIYNLERSGEEWVRAQIYFFLKHRLLEATRQPNQSILNFVSWTTDWGSKNSSRATKTTEIGFLFPLCFCFFLKSVSSIRGVVDVSTTSIWPPDDARERERSRSRSRSNVFRLLNKHSISE